MRRDVVVTGAGLVSAQGEGLATHLAALAAGRPAPVAPEPFSGRTVHPAPALDWSRQVPKKADQRQMEPWQRLGVYAAGLALEVAGDPALKARMQLIVSSGGGERDFAVDEGILTELRAASQPGPLLNERLSADLRPTLFLAQLSNLLAGNIAIVHGVTGASRTFMGEEAAGTDALRIAHARICARQADIMLVGGSYNAERPDMILVHALGGYLWSGGVVPVFGRAETGRGGFIAGSGAAFLVIEAADHARERGVSALASLAAVASDRARPEAVEDGLVRLWHEIGAEPDDVVLSGATGVAGPTAAEGAALRRLVPEGAIHAVGDLFGHMMEAQAPAATALGAGLIASGRARGVVATTVGHRRGIGLVRLAAPS